MADIGYIQNKIKEIKILLEKEEEKRLENIKQYDLIKKEIKESNERLDFFFKNYKHISDPEFYVYIKNEIFKMLEKRLFEIMSELRREIIKDQKKITQKTGDELKQKLENFVFERLETVGKEIGYITEEIIEQRLKKHMFLVKQRIAEELISLRHRKWKKLELCLMMMSTIITSEKSGTGLGNSIC